MKKQVALVGFASSSREQANSLPPEVEIWGENQLYRSNFLKRADRWFEMHSRALYDTRLDLRRPPEHVQWLSRFKGPVYMIDQQPDIPNSVRYPLEDVVADLGGYLTSTIAYMLALAIHERYETIYLYGVDMADRAEYAEQRACCEYLIGVAKGRGIKVKIPESSPLLKGPLYGRGDLNPGGERITDSQYEKRLADLRKTEAAIEKEISARHDDLQIIKGAILETSYWINVTPAGSLWHVLSQAAPHQQTLTQTTVYSTNGKTAEPSLSGDQHG